MPNVIEKMVNKVLGKGTTDNAADPIPTGAANLTLGTAFIGAVTLIVDNFTGWSSKLLGPDPGSGSQAALAIAIIGAMAIVFAADLLARGYASAHAAPAASKPAESSGVTVSIPELAAADEGNWQVVQVDGDRLLLVKKGEPPQWYPISKVRGE
ncbi:hypothetical protein QRX60_50760 [Amycolatopsis mongoliensis]|uniref:Uncharacterized protein n=1 Tax=Amycolatopsis mongoliensis TaxID=715475 RepID=A0A9Y2JSK8_9PSEU|nr:hypothetical protein [Amycolatopsis sp. 4-36]WIY02179.1 hypothetical protein QRX60_50760 [Amycolatopsis sp. 4-36]